MIEGAVCKLRPLVIAVRSQHAYERTLLWEERNNADAERALLRHLASGRGQLAGRSNTIVSPELRKQNK